MKNSNVLIAMIEGGGNVTPMLGFATTLIENGHSVTILSEPCLEEPIREIGASFVPFKEYFVRTNRKEDIFKDWNTSKINNPIFERVMFGPAASVIDRCQELIQSLSIDLLVVDVLIFPGIIAAENLGIPKIILFHMPEFLPGPNRPPGNMGVKPGSGLFYRMRDKLLSHLMVKKLDEYKYRLNEILNSLSLPLLEHSMDLFDRADLRLIQTNRFFDVPIEPSPSNVRYIGPVLDDPDWVSKETWNQPWSEENSKPIIAISFSSTYQNQASVIQRCIDALKGLPVYGCVTIGPAMQDVLFDTPENVEVLHSVKHSELFSHADLVITHGGHGTIMKALSRGLPMICLPMGRDQYDNAIKVSIKGCGIKLSSKSSSAKIRKSILEIQKNSHFKENARRMQEELKNPEDLNTVISEIQELITNKDVLIKVE